MEKAKRAHKFQSRWAVDFLIIALGAAIYAIGINVFIAPNSISTGGATGIAMIANHLFRLPIGIGILILNLPLFAAALWKFGGRFLLKTAVATVLSSVLIDTTASVLPAYTGSNTLLAALFGGALTGFGIGMVFLRGGTTGGTDILAKLIQKHSPHLSLGTIVFVSDLIIVAGAYFAYRSLETLLYSAIVFFVSSRTIDYLLFGASRSKLLIIVTKEASAITGKITNSLLHGVTILPAKGGYSDTARNALLCVMRPNEVSKAVRIIKETDTDAFTIITDAAEVLGLGFRHE